MSFTIQLLPSAQFDRLPYKTEGALGLADYKHGKAYVRRTGIPAVDLLNINHELQELLADVSPHEEDGIRYKKGGAARSIVPMVLGTIVGTFTGMPWLGAAIGGASGFGMGAYATSNHPELGWQAPVFGALSGAAGGYGGTTALQGGMAGWGASAGQSLGSQLLSAGQGALFGTTGSAAAGTAQSLLAGPVGGASYGAGVGLLGSGTLGGALMGNSLVKNAGSLAATTLLNGGNTTQAPQQVNYVYQPSPSSSPYFRNSQVGFNESTATSAKAPASSLQTVKSTPSALSSGWSSAPQAGNLGGNLTNFDMLIPGRARQGNLYTWR